MLLLLRTSAFSLKRTATSVHAQAVTWKWKFRLKVMPRPSSLLLRFHQAVKHISRRDFVYLALDDLVHDGTIGINRGNYGMNSPIV